MANGNEHGPESLVLRMLRDIGHKQDLIMDNVRDLKLRMTALEAFVTSSMTVVNGRLDRIEARLDRIEGRLEVSEHA
jgi:hypothetical protein